MLIEVLDIMEQSLYIIDDDSDIREYISAITDSLHIMNQSYKSATEFLASYRSDFQGCILSDVLMPDMTGLEFQEQLIHKNIKLPLILMSSFGNISMVKMALKRGAIDFLEKPLNIQELTQSILSGLQISDEQNKRNHQVDDVERKLHSLTKREYEIFILLINGIANHQIANNLSLSVRTIETHRYRIMKKMEVNSLMVLAQTFKYLIED